MPEAISRRDRDQRLLDGARDSIRDEELRRQAGAAAASGGVAPATGGVFPPVTWNWTDRGGGISLPSLKSATHAGGSWPGVRATKYLLGNGAWYWEVYIDTLPLNVMIGLANAELQLSASAFVGNTPDSYGYYQTGVKYNNNVATAYGASYTTGDVIGVAFKVAAGVGSLWFRKNGAWQNAGDPAAGTNPAFTGIAANAWFPTVSFNGTAGKVTLRALAAAFSGSAPAGFSALDA